MLTEAQLQHTRESMVKGVSLYGALMSQAGEAVTGSYAWNDVRRNALHMSAALSYVVNTIKTSEHKALVRLAMVLLANCVAFAVARRPSEVKINRLTKPEDLAKLLSVI